MSEHSHITKIEPQEDINTMIYDILWHIKHFSDDKILVHHIEPKIKKLKDKIKPCHTCLTCGQEVIIEENKNV